MSDYLRSTRSPRPRLITEYKVSTNQPELVQAVLDMQGELRLVREQLADVKRRTDKQLAPLQADQFVMYKTMATHALIQHVKKLLGWGAKQPAMPKSPKGSKTV